MYQQLTIVGRLGKDPEMRYTQAGTPVTSFSVATDRVWTNDQGQKQTETTWFSVSAWNKQAEACAQYLTKGSMVLVTGTVKARGYTTRDGEIAANMEVKADTVRFLTTKESQQVQQAGNGAGSNQTVNVDEIPF